MLLIIVAAVLGGIIGLAIGLAAGLGFGGCANCDCDYCADPCEEVE